VNRNCTIQYRTWLKKLSKPSYKAHIAKARPLLYDQSIFERQYSRTAYKAMKDLGCRNKKKNHCRYVRRGKYSYMSLDGKRALRRLCKHYPKELTACRKQCDLSYKLFRELNYDECLELRRPEWKNECSKLYRGFLTWQGWEAKEDEWEEEPAVTRVSIKKDLKTDARLFL